MIALRKSQPLKEFQKSAAETLDTLNKTGDGQLLTVDGKARGVLLSMAAYEELEQQALLAQDVEMIRQSGRDIETGDFMEAGQFFRQLHAEALELQSREDKEPPQVNRPTVIVPRAVQVKIREQFQRIARHSLRNAIRWEQRFGLAIDALADAPGHAVDEKASKRLGFTVRKLTFERTYLVHYVFDEGRSIIEVRGFRHGARRPRRGEP